MENKYQRGKIYKIVDVGYNKCYIGSTTEKLLSNRMSKHRNHYRNFKQDTANQLYYIVFELFDEFDLTNCKIELIENYPCNSKEELLSREGFYILNTECINKRVAGRTKQQYNYQKREEISLKRAVKEHCVCGSSVSKRNGARHLTSQKHQQYCKSLQD